MGVTRVQPSVCLLLILIALPHCYPFNVLLKHTKLAESRVENPRGATLETDLSFIRSGSLCAMKDWCLVHCWTASGVSILMSIIVVPFNEDPEGPPWMECYTKRNPFNILTAQSGIKVHDASPVLEINHNRIPENLLDGIYDGNMKNCFRTVGNLPFIVLDIIDSQEINSVLVIAQNNTNFENQFKELDILVGSSPASGDFENYTQLSYYRGPPPYAGYELIVRSELPITGKYLSIQKTHTENNTALQIYHLEIYA